MKKCFLFFFLVFFFLSCETNDPIQCFLPSPVIESNSPVVSGDNINLSSSNALFNATYEWTGPNGFQSSEQYPILTNANSSMSGEYKLKVKKGLCESEVVSTNVEIITNTVNCMPVNNTGIFTSLSSPEYFYSVSAVSSSPHFSIRAGNLHSNLEIKFPANNEPTVGIYSIIPPEDNLSLNTYQVHLNLELGNAFGSFLYHAKSGDILLSKNSEGKLYVIFCDIPFYKVNNINPSNFGTVKVTVQ